MSFIHTCEGWLKLIAHFECFDGSVVSLWGGWRLGFSWDLWGVFGLLESCEGDFEGLRELLIGRGCN